MSPYQRRIETLKLASPGRNTLNKMLCRSCNAKNIEANFIKLNQIPPVLARNLTANFCSVFICLIVPEWGFASCLQLRALLDANQIPPLVEFGARRPMLVELPMTVEFKVVSFLQENGFGLESSEICSEFILFTLVFIHFLYLFSLN